MTGQLLSPSLRRAGDGLMVVLAAGFLWAASPDGLVWDASWTNATTQAQASRAPGRWIDAESGLGESGPVALGRDCAGVHDSTTWSVPPTDWPSILLGDLTSGVEASPDAVENRITASGRPLASMPISLQRLLAVEDDDSPSPAQQFIALPGLD